MEGWKTEKLGKICEMYQPQTIAASDLIPNGKYYVYGANGIIGKYDRYNHEQCELLMTCRGNTCGEITVSKPYSWINGNAMVIRPKTDNIKRDYIEHFLKFTRLASIITGGAQPQITRGDLKMLKITYPASLSEQTAIAKILSTVDEAIRSTRDTISKLERVKKSLMQNLLSGKMKPDGTLRPAAEFYEDEKMGLVPKGWKSVKFGDRVKILYGKNQSSVKSENGNIPVLGTGGLIEYANEPLCSHPSIIIGRKGTIDKPYYLSQPFWCVDTAYYVDEFIEGDMKYLLYVLQRMNLKSLNEATGVPSLTKRTLYRQRIVLPTKEEQIIIVSKIEEIESSIQQKQEKTTTLDLLKKSLMQQLLTGRVRVK